MNKIRALAISLIDEQALPLNFARFYAVGLLLYAIPFTRPLFFSITAASIVLVLAAALYHHKRWTLSTILLFALIAISSFSLEVLGVATGTVFGAYHYDTSLGYKLWDTPLLIGLNWVMLVYASQSIASRVSQHVVVRILLASLLMVGYDLVLEVAAPYMQMWHFDIGYPPIDNFVVWLLAAMFFHTLMIVFRIDVNNRPARMLFLLQFLFFCTISLYSIFFIGQP